MCPIMEEVKYDMRTGDTLGFRVKKLFWVYYPEARTWLSRYEVFNPNNDAERRSFDDMFFKRRFASYIEKESNVYNDRRIPQYKKGLDALLEAEKIKMAIFRMEHDLWEY